MENSKDIELTETQKRIERLQMNPRASESYKFFTAYMQAWMGCSHEEAVKIMEGLYFGMLSLCRKSGLVKFPNGLVFAEGETVNENWLPMTRCKFFDAGELKRITPPIFTGASKLAVLNCVALDVVKMLEERGISFDSLQSYVDSPEFL